MLLKDKKEMNNAIKPKNGAKIKFVDNLICKV